MQPRQMPIMGSKGETDDYDHLRAAKISGFVNALMATNMWVL